MTILDLGKMLFVIAGGIGCCTIPVVVFGYHNLMKMEFDRCRKAAFIAIPLLVMMTAALSTSIFLFIFYALEHGA